MTNSELLYYSAGSDGLKFTVPNVANCHKRQINKSPTQHLIIELIPAVPSAFGGRSQTQTRNSVVAQIEYQPTRIFIAEREVLRNNLIKEPKIKF